MISLSSARITRIRGAGFAGPWSTRRCSEAAFLSERDPRVEAEVLVRKAEDDANAMRLLADAEISDEIVGAGSIHRTLAMLRFTYGRKGKGSD